MYCRKRFCLPKDDATIKRWNLKYLANDARKTEKEKWHTRFNLASFQTAQHATPLINDFTIIFTICIQCSHSAVLCDDVQLVLLHLVSRAEQLLLSDRLLYKALKVSIYRCCCSSALVTLNVFWMYPSTALLAGLLAQTLWLLKMRYRKIDADTLGIKHIDFLTLGLTERFTGHCVKYACFSVYSLCTYQRACAHVCCVRVCIFERLCVFI